MAIVRFINQQVGTGLTVQAAVEKLLPRFKVLLERTMFDHSAEDKTDQVDFLLLLQQECLRQEKGEDILARLSLRLTVDDVIQAEGLEQWWEDEKSNSGDMGKVRGKTKQVVDAVIGDSDEESEEEDDDEENEDDE
jgi:translation initiation factor eIF-2B subunit epsilon